MLKNSEVLCDNFKQGKAVVMATILSKQGSAPRSAGTKMVFNALIISACFGIARLINIKIIW